MANANRKSSMSKPVARQLFILLGNLSWLMMVNLVISLVLSFGRPLAFVLVCSLFQVLVLMLVSVKVSKLGVMDLLKTATTKWVNTASGPRRSDEDNGLPPRPADGGVLQWKQGLFNPGFFTMLACSMVLLDLLRLMGLVIAYGSVGSPFISHELVLKVHEPTYAVRYAFDVLFSAVVLYLMVSWVKRSHGLKKAGFWTVLFALLNHDIFASPLTASVPKYTFVDPASGRVRRVYREAGESYEPSTSTAKSWSMGAAPEVSGA